VEEVELLALGVLLEKGRVARRIVGDAQVAGRGEVLFGPHDLTLQALKIIVYGMLVRGRTIARMLSLPRMIVQCQRADHGLAPTVAAGPRDPGTIEADRHCGDGHLQHRQGVALRLFFGGGQGADPLGDILSMRCGDVATMTLLQVLLLRTHVELRLLVAELTGEPRDGPVHDARLLVEWTIDPSAA
jgi:hypothetical protein